MQYDHALAVGYRESDERAAERGELDATAARLRAICRSYDREITVLDLGCGTGRFFHAIENARLLLGIDASDDMLAEAAHPVREAEVSAREVALRKGDLTRLDLPPASFDLVYSIGVLGNHAPFDVDVATSVHRLLTPDGHFVFSIVDRDSKPRSLRRRLGERMLPVLPGPLRRAAAARQHTFYMTRTELEHTLDAAGFSHRDIDRTTSTSPDWTGAVFDCHVRR